MFISDRWKGVNVFQMAHIEGQPRKEQINCKACGSVCNVERDCYGPTGFVQGMAGSKTIHDLFECPNTAQEWHIQAITLYRERSDTSSPSLRSLIQKDLDALVSKHRTTAASNVLILLRNSPFKV